MSELQQQEKKKPKGGTVACVVCKRAGCFTKYKRHLFSHAKKNEIARKDVYKVLFKVRIPRSDAKNNFSAGSRSGYICRYRNEFNKKCRRIVLNIRHHLVHFHKLEKSSLKYQELMANISQKQPMKRFTRTRSAHTICQANPIDLSSTSFSSELLLDNSHIESPVDDQIHTKDLDNNHYDVITDESDFEYSTEYEIEGEENPSMNNSIIPIPLVYSCGSSSGNNLSSLKYIDSEKIIGEFRSFLVTKGGGGRRNTPIKGDISQFRSIMRGLGWSNFWDPNKLNIYVSSALCSPSTLYCRLRVYERFIHFLRMQIPSFLPSAEQLKGIDSMLSSLKEAIGKDRHSRRKHVMAVSRERMPMSFDVLRLWRSRRASVEVKEHFGLFMGECEDISELMFRQLRNYLLVEVILANAQRSGIIEGMLIKEVLDAKSTSNTDNLHYIYVENHKTGHIQPAIIYLETEIYNYLVTFTNRIIPLLPSIKQSRTESNSHVFQTWTSDRLRTSTISSCMRAGLKLFGIEDPKGCPTNFRKAASTLISMHQPSMQESLSQFMCHARSTTERHYRHHMSHRGLSSVFTELARSDELFVF